MAEDEHFAKSDPTTMCVMGGLVMNWQLLS